MGELIPLFGRSAAAEPVEDTTLESATPEPIAIFTRIEETSLTALGRKQLSRRELERVLAKQGYHEQAIADELDRLEAVGLVDDYALAQQLVASLQERKGLAGSAIKAELARRIVSPGAIEYAMDLIDTGDELARAREIAVARARQYGALDVQVVERRLAGYLMRRGFSPSTVRAAVDAALRSA